MSNTQWFKTDLHFVEFSDEEMTVIEYQNWSNEPTLIEKNYFPRDFKRFFELFKIASLEEISKEEFDKMYVLAKINKNYTSLIAA